MTEDKSIDIIIPSSLLMEPDTTRGGAIQEIDYKISLILSKYYKIVILGPYYGKYIKNKKVNSNFYIQFIEFPAIKFYPPKSINELYFGAIIRIPFCLILVLIKLIYLSKFNPRLFIVHNNILGYFSAIFAKFLGCNTILFEGNLIPWVEPRIELENICQKVKIINRIKKKLGISICNLSANIITQTEIIRDGMVNSGIDSNKIVVIPAGIETDSTIKHNNKIVLSKNFIRIGFIGRLYEEKGAKLLLDVVKLAFRQLPKARFIILGDGQLKNSFAQINNIEHIGWVPKNDLYSWIAKTDIFLFFQKALGLAELEVMASGKVIIACDIGDVSRTISHLKNGMLCNANAQSYVNTIEFLCENPHLISKLSKASRETIEERFSWRIVGKEWVKICKINIDDARQE